MAQVLDILWGGPETLIVISSDLSHYHAYAEAQRMDKATCQAVEALDVNGITDDQACGRIPMRGLMALARRKGLQVSTVDLRNSGDTAGPKDRVVGYGSWVFVEPTEDDFANATKKLLHDFGPVLLRTAAASILHGLNKGAPVNVDVKSFPAPLAAPGACFVTLRKKGELRGCIGSSIAHRPLIQDTAENGFAAAFKDPRFPKLQPQEIGELELSMSVLSAPRPMTVKDEADLLAQLRPRVDGLIIVDQQHRALFLPSVWEQLPSPREFLMRLKMKAGLAPDHWSPTFQALRFVAEEIEAKELPDSAALWRM